VAVAVNQLPLRVLPCGDVEPLVFVPHNVESVYVPVVLPPPKRRHHHRRRHSGLRVHGVSSMDGVGTSGTVEEGVATAAVLADGISGDERSGVAVEGPRLSEGDAAERDGDAVCGWGSDDDGVDALLSAAARTAPSASAGPGTLCRIGDSDSSSDSERDSDGGDGSGDVDGVGGAWPTAVRSVTGSAWPTLLCREDWPPFPPAARTAMVASLSAPATLCFLAELARPVVQPLTRARLCVHVVAANAVPDMHAVRRYELLLHLIPALRSVHLRFFAAGVECDPDVDPDADAAERGDASAQVASEGVFDDGVGSVCEVCAGAGRRLHVAVCAHPYVRYLQRLQRRDSLLHCDSRASDGVAGRVYGAGAYAGSGAVTCTDVCGGGGGDAGGGGGAAGATGAHSDGATSSDDATNSDDLSCGCVGSDDDNLWPTVAVRFNAALGAHDIAWIRALVTSARMRSAPVVVAVTVPRASDAAATEAVLVEAAGDAWATVQTVNNPLHSPVPSIDEEDVASCVFAGAFVVVATVL
jgi:hypothetical protein